MILLTINPWVQNVIEKIVLPVAVATITYILFRKLDEWKKRKSYSKLGIAIMDSLIEEVKVGISIMKASVNPNSNNTSQLPNKSWDGMRTIPDEVLLRIIEVARTNEPKSFPLNEIRIHCKNYFYHMAPSWANAIEDKTNWRDKVCNLIDSAKYLESAERVLIMLEQAKNLLQLNSSRNFPS